LARHRTLRRIGLLFGGLLALAVVFVAAGLKVAGVNLPWSAARLIGLAEADAAELEGRLRPVAGWQVGLYAEGLGRPRLMVLTGAGDILVSIAGSGNVLKVLADANGDGRADQVQPFLDGLDRPHGLALHGGWLYVAEESTIRRIRFDGATGATSGALETVLAGLPRGDGHWTRTIAFGPDGKLYATAGSSCNVCIETNPWRAAMLRMDADGADPEVFASGLRNTVGFDWQPVTGDLYGVDNGRDLLGDDRPPDELNRLREGGFYGWPYFWGDNRPDPQYGARPEAAGMDPIAPAHKFAAHVAPLSIRFLRHQLDPAWNGTALVAQHGSWNRSSKIGYRVVALRWHDGGSIEQETFLDGFRDGETVFGRPVDVLEAPNGTLYVSDDFAGAIWRMTPAK